jgi:hypothetical protein
VRRSRTHHKIGTPRIFGQVLVGFIQLGERNPENCLDLIRWANSLKTQERSLPPASLLQAYKGYIKEALLYPTCVLRGEPDLRSKFVIFGIPRSGSTLLVGLLDSHPQIHCEGELLIHRLFFPRSYINCRYKRCQKDAFGFKLLVDHFETQKIQDARQFLKELEDNGYRIIYLRRDNLYRAALSSLYGSFIGKYHLSQKQENQPREKMVVDPEALLSKLKRFEYLASQQRAILGDLPHLDIVYEKDLVVSEQHQNTIDRISGFLGLSRSQVHSDLIRVTTEDVSGFVENATELETMISISPYAKYLE